MKNEINEMRGGVLRLADDTVFEGYSFGYEQPTTGEMVFCTAMTGYPESLTDPSYRGQILAFTYPMIGNYGVPSRITKEGQQVNRLTSQQIDGVFESERIQCAAIICADYSAAFSHYDAAGSLGEWLHDERVPALCGIDTRRLTQHLRSRGTMIAEIEIEGQHGNGRSSESKEVLAQSLPSRDGRRAKLNRPTSQQRNLVAEVSTDRVIDYGNGRRRVLLVDCGVKMNILRCLLRRGISVRIVPWDYNFTSDDYDGLLLSNGPGDPAVCIPTIQHLRTMLAHDDRPVMGICLGHQLMALAAGARTYKMTYGHRGHNHTVRLAGTHRCFVTAQNHGYAVDAASLPNDWECLYENVNDGTVEGIRHTSKPFFAVQFHPEASGGPTDTEDLFDQFVNML
jgi:carbamoyl-phosphate synthase, small subunit